MRVSAISVELAVGDLARASYWSRAECRLFRNADIEPVTTQADRDCGSRRTASDNQHVTGFGLPGHPRGSSDGPQRRDRGLFRLPVEIDRRRARWRHRTAARKELR